MVTFERQHGESEHNFCGRIGGDTSLTARGRQYAGALGRYIRDQNLPSLRVWTSWMKRTIQTAKYIDAPQERWRALNEIDAGICEEMTYEETLPSENFPTISPLATAISFSTGIRAVNRTRTWWRVWSRSSWSWSARRMSSSSATRRCCVFCWPTFSTNRRVNLTEF